MKLKLGGLIVGSLDEGRVKDAFDIGIKPKKVLGYFCQNMHYSVLQRNREELLKAPVETNPSGKRRKRHKNENLMRLLPDNMIEVVYMWYDDYKLKGGLGEH